MVRPTPGLNRTAPLTRRRAVRPHSVISMRNDERRWSEFCARKALGRYFRAKGLTTRWEKGSEPPDWWAYLDGVRHAIEVTRAYGRFVPAGDKVYRSAAEQWEFFSKLGSDLHLLVSDIPGSGSHYLHMQAMNVSREERAEVLAEVRDYVLCHLSASQAPKRVVLKKKGASTLAVITIEKKSSGGTGVGWSYSEGGSLPRGGSDIEHELRQIVASAVKSKIDRTSAIQEPKVLVIVDTYRWAPESFWEELRFEAGPFTAVFRATPSGYCQLLAEGEVCYTKKDR